MSQNISIFLSGICMACFAASGVFFFKFWRASRDRFFLFFSISCGLIALERVALLLLRSPQSTMTAPQLEATSWIYLIRLVAFILIFIAVIEKNRNSKVR